MEPNQDAEPLDLEEIAGDDGEPKESKASPLPTREHSQALADTQNVMRRFNRTTMWVATGLLGTSIIAAVALVLQDPHPMAASLAEEPRQNNVGLVSNATPAPLSEAVGWSGKNADEIVPEQVTSSESQLTPGINHPGQQANVNSTSKAQRQDLARVIRPKNPNPRSRPTMWSRLVGVKMRLVALWHQSLAKSQKPRGWTLLSNSQARRKKVSYVSKNNPLIVQRGSEDA